LTVFRTNVFPISLVPKHSKYKNGFSFSPDRVESFPDIFFWRETWNKGGKMDGKNAESFAPEKNKKTEFC